MNKTKKIFSLIAAVIMQALVFSTGAQAQCSMKNTALGKSEVLAYNLYFNWQFIWVKAGTASMSTVSTVYKGKPAFRSSLITRTSDKVDKFFRMRDTLLVYSTDQLAPLYYRKGAHEGERYYVDEAWYAYPNGKCAVTMKHKHRDGSITNEKKTYDHCVYDMLNIFLRARSFDPKNWKAGHTVNIDITGGSELVKAKLVYQGKETIKADNEKKYKCLVLSYIEKEDGKDKEIVRFFVTDDRRHVPIRLDLFLRFGSAKAFLSGMK